MSALEYIDHFKTTPAWAQMVATVEDSPWHREANVAVHTEMVLHQYMTRFMPLRLPHQNRVALLALLYHDVGKPEAEEVVTTNVERGAYRRYAGHEQNSAVAFTEAWLQDEKLRALLSPHDARVVRWIIEHHLPYGLKDPQKVAAFRAATTATLGIDQVTFFDCLRSDAAGRISDDHDEKLQKVEDWIEQFEATRGKVAEVARPYGSIKPGTAYILIGPSGSGKSTWVRQGMRACDRLVSMDRYRLDFFDQITDDPKRAYAAAFEHAAQNEAAFNEYMRKAIAAAFQDLRLTGGDAYIDNTNSTRKSRARWVQEARGAGMKVVGVEFWNPLQVVLDRQATRTDKTVPAQAVRSQYYAQTCAWLGGEVDEVIVVANGQEALIL